MNLSRQRNAIRHLLNERQPADATAAYYAFYHPDDKTRIFLEPDQAARADGFLTISRTGIDLFRPLVTMHLPPDDYPASTDLIYRALQPGTPVILHVPNEYAPLIHALFQIQTEERLKLYVLDRQRFEPIINVLVTQSTGANGLPRYVIRAKGGDRQVVAAAGLNWQSPYFGDISVQTNPNHRRRGWGRSVVAAMSQHLLENGRIPLYSVTAENHPSIQLATSIGFIDSGVRRIIMQGVLKPRPQ